MSVLSHQFGNDLDDESRDLDVRADHRGARRRRAHHADLRRELPRCSTALRAAALGQPVLPEIAPITGPMYQLFVFFMITDPRTVVRGRRRRSSSRCSSRSIETLIRLASDEGWPLPTAFNAAPALLALAIVGPVAKFLDLRRSRA